MKILHAYNQHRGGGGADNAARATIEVSRQDGMEIEVFTRRSDDLPKNIVGRIRAGASMIYAPASVRRFTALLDRFQPDIVHIHEVFPLVSPWILPPCTQRGIPVVKTCVDYRMTCPIVTHLRDGAICTLCTERNESWVVRNNCRGDFAASVSVALYNTLVRKIGLFHRHVSHYIAPSDFTREWMIEHGGIPPARITTINPIVEIPESSADPGLGEYVGFAGRFSREKGIETLGEAARLSGLPFRLARHCDSLVTVDVPSETQVVITHNRDELNTFYRNARMLVVPSQWLETFGLVGAEAMSHGIPVVGARIGAMTNLIRDGVDGLLFEPGNAVDLTQKVTRLWNDPELCRRLGRAARERAVAEWAPHCHFERHRALYERLQEDRTAPLRQGTRRDQGHMRTTQPPEEESARSSTDNDAAPSPRDMELLGLPIHDVDVEQVHAFIAETISSQRRALVLHANVNGVNLACKHAWLHDFFQTAHLVFCDGDGVRLGLRILGYSPPPKITYNEWIWLLAAFCQRQGYRLFLLGSRAGVAREAAAKLTERYARLDIVGTEDGYFNKRGEENDRVITRINAASPDILLVCLGAPLQEQWLADNWSRLGAQVFLTGGAALDYASGNLNKAPRWMVRSHIEWLYRLYQDPVRLFNRYMIGNPLFLIRVLAEKATRIRRREFGTRRENRRIPRRR